MFVFHLVVVGLGLLGFTLGDGDPLAPSRPTVDSTVARVTYLEKLADIRVSGEKAEAASNAVAPEPEPLPLLQKIPDTATLTKSKGERKKKRKRNNPEEGGERITQKRSSSSQVGRKKGQRTSYLNLFVQLNLISYHISNLKSDLSGFQSSY